MRIRRSWWASNLKVWHLSHHNSYQIKLVDSVSLKVLFLVFLQQNAVKKYLKLLEIQHNCQSRANFKMENSIKYCGQLPHFPSGASVLSEYGCRIAIQLHVCVELSLKISIVASACLVTNKFFSWFQKAVAWAYQFSGNAREIVKILLMFINSFHPPPNLSSSIF